MSTGQGQVNTEVQGAPAPVVKVQSKKSDSVLDKFLGVLSSVRFGIIMLSLLLVCCMIGMLVMQVEVQGFQEYYQSLPPAQRDLYRVVGFFDIYHSWYFNLLLAITGLNIILASIDRFPTAWQYIAKPKLSASPNFIRAQMFSEEMALDAPPRELAEKTAVSWKIMGLRAKVNEENNRYTVFAQKNTWNRLGAYVVHVALLTIFIGGFLTSRFGVGGMMEIRPGQSSNRFTTSQMTLDGQKLGEAILPFTIECTDLQQKLIRPEGGLEAQNTIDWLSHIKIKDADTELATVVHMNNPKDYKGYRFFQSQFTAFGSARSIKVNIVPVDGGPVHEVTLSRNGSQDVAGVGRIRYDNFYPDTVNSTGNYDSPVAELEISTPDGKKVSGLAFDPQKAEEFLSKSKGSSGESEANPLVNVNGKTYVLVMTEFEKAALGHTLAVQYDPGRVPVYIGFTLLVIALCGVFFFSHQRVWAVIEPSEKGSKIYFGANTNRNRQAFEARFNSLVESVVRERK